MLKNKFSVLSLIKCTYQGAGTSATDNGDIDGYHLIPASPCVGMLYVTENNPEFISGHIRVRGRAGGCYPYHYLQMIDELFGPDKHTIEVCSGYVDAPREAECTVDINQATKANCIDDGERLAKTPDEIYTRYRADPPYNVYTAGDMYKTDLPETAKLLKAGARVIKPGSLMFLLLGPKNYQICPEGVKRIGWIAMTVVPSNELRALHIFYKYESEPKRRLEEF